jgi:DNA/RNA endonuclease YhcR with UshA esterase domain
MINLPVRIAMGFTITSATMTPTKEDKAISISDTGILIKQYNVNVLYW